MDLETESLKYEWGRLFASPWEAVVDGMDQRAGADGLTQEVDGWTLTWMAGDAPVVRYVFIDDPSDFGAVRAVYTDESNARVPVCFVVVRQPDETDDRGDVIFDIFRMSPKSYLWHFNRVYTAPGAS
jgi:hypothetical protein